MKSFDALRNRIHTILAKHFGAVHTSTEGEFRVVNDSAHLFVSVDHGFGTDGLVVKLTCPLVNRVPLSTDLDRWVSIEGRNFLLGGIFLIPHANGTHGELWFSHNFSADDLDEKELLGSIYPILVLCNELDNQLQSRFGGHLFSD
jgi:hypothetical protein